MKKLFVIITVVLVLAALAGCAGETKNEESAKVTETSAEATESGAASESETQIATETETESETVTETETVTEIVTEALDPAKTILGTWGMNPTAGSETHLEFTADGRVINRDLMFGAYAIDGANVNVTFDDFADQNPIVYKLDGGKLVFEKQGENGKKEFERMTGESNNAVGTYICVDDDGKTVITLKADGRITYSLTTYRNQTYSLAGSRLTMTVPGEDGKAQSTAVDISFPDTRDEMIMTVDGKEITLTRIE